MTFKRWLVRFEGDDSELGEFADQYSRDKEFPRTRKIGKMMDYLFNQDFSLEEFTIFFEAYKEYYKEKYA